METAELIERLMRLAAGDPVLRETLITAGGQENPVGSFCRAAREAGVELYEMDLIAYGEESHAALKRSTNGGGENSPMLAGEDDYYELFLTELE